MYLIFSVLFIAAAALASPIKNVQLRYEKIMHDIDVAEGQYYSLPDPKDQMYYMNAYSILRLSDHLKMNFEEIQEQVLNEMCHDQSQCFGSVAFQKGVIKVCLHSDDYVSHQVELYENFTSCSDQFLTQLVNQIESTKDRMDELRYSKMKLMQEYKDSRNRYELEMVLDYHEEIINENELVLMYSINNLRDLYDSLKNAMRICSRRGYPKISKKLYMYANVQQCMRDFLTTEPKHDHTEEELKPTEKEPETSSEANQESHEEAQELPQEPNQESQEGAIEFPQEPNQGSDNHESHEETQEHPQEPNQESHEEPQEHPQEPNQELDDEALEFPTEPNQELHEETHEEAQGSNPDNENEEEDAREDDYFIHDI